MKFSATVFLFALLTSSIKAESQEYESVYGPGTRAIESFSSANGGFSGYYDSPIYAIECYNGWCSDKVIWYSADLTEDLNRDLEKNTPFFSEEGSARQDCPPGMIVSRIQCTGDRCDNMSLYCSPFKSDSPFEVSTTDFANQNSFSEEQNGLDPHYRCPESYYVSGIGCSGGWCDNISFRCAKVTYSTLGDYDLEIVYSKGSFGDMETTKEYFNEVFQGDKSTFIIRRECTDCTDTHKDVYFKRTTSPTTFDAYENMIVTWSDTNNIMHQDFDIFSTFDDALAGVNPWNACNYDDFHNQIGFPRDCGPNSIVTWQWNSDLHTGTRQNYRYSVILEVDTVCSE